MHHAQALIDKRKNCYVIAVMSQQRRIRGHTLPNSEPQQVSEQILGAVVYSSVFISCCAFSLTIETYKLASIPIALPVAGFIFLATFFIYNLSSVYYVLVLPNKKGKKADHWVEMHKRAIAIVSLISITAATWVYIYYKLHINFWVVFHLALISVWYTIPIGFKSFKVKPLRSIPLLKVFLIAYVWAVVTVLFPLLNSGSANWDMQMTLLLLRRFLFILALALLFDIRDYAYDKHRKTLTIPGLLGVNNTKILSLGLLLLYSVLVVLHEQGTVQVALLAGASIAALVVGFADERRPRVYYALLADGAMLLHAGLVYLAFS